MRGAFVDQGGLFSYIAPEARVPANHPLRKIRELVRGVLGELNRSLGRLYASEGRPSIPPEQLLSALLLQVFYGIRSERQLMELTFRHSLDHIRMSQISLQHQRLPDGLAAAAAKSLSGRFYSWFYIRSCSRLVAVQLPDDRLRGGGAIDIAADDLRRRSPRPSPGFRRSRAPTGRRRRTGSQPCRADHGSADWRRPCPPRSSPC